MKGMVISKILWYFIITVISEFVLLSKKLPQIFRSDTYKIFLYKDITGKLLECYTVSAV